MEAHTLRLIGKATLEGEIDVSGCQAAGVQHLDEGARLAVHHDERLVGKRPQRARNRSQRELDRHGHQLSILHGNKEQGGRERRARIEQVAP